MDQLRQVGEFIWKWRFWFSVGLASLLALLIQFFGVPNVQAQVQARTGQLDNTFNQISRFPPNSPNKNWTDEATKEEQTVAQQVSTVHEQIFAEQAKRLIWPEGFAQFNDRPFNHMLIAEQGTVPFLYFRAFDKQFEDLRQIVQPISEDADGYAQGKVRLRENALDRPKWDRAPTDDRELFLAQEQLWIQRAVLEAIAKINENAKDWRDAPIREILRISIGQEGVDIRRAAEQQGDAKLNELPPTTIVGSMAPPPVPTGPGGGKQDDSSGLNRVRYVEPVGGNFRTIPLGIRILGDQAKLPEILAGLGATEFLFVVKECNWSIPAAKVEVPRYEDVTPGSTRDIVDTTLEIVIKGDVRIYEMPPAQKQAWLQAQTPGQPGAPGTPVPPVATPGAPVPAPGQPIVTPVAPASPGTPPATVPPPAAGAPPVTVAPAPSAPPATPPGTTPPGGAPPVAAPAQPTPPAVPAPM